MAKLGVQTEKAEKVMMYCPNTFTDGRRSELNKIKSHTGGLIVQFPKGSNKMVYLI